MPDRNLLPRVVLGVIALFLCLIAAGTFVMSESTVIRAICTVVLVAYIVFLAASHWVEARLNERHVEKHPHLLKNEAVGETVTVSGDFEPQSGAARGMVLLHGERWKAYCCGDHVPRDGDIMIVQSREGLTLAVQPQGVT